MSLASENVLELRIRSGLPTPLFPAHRERAETLWPQVCPARLVGDPKLGPTYLLHLLSVLSLAFASAIVCHCMLLVSSAPPHFSGTMWSTT